MKRLNQDDPRITAFALGELTGSEALELARAVREDAQVREAVDAVRETAGMLGDVLSPAGAEMLRPAQREAIRSAGGVPVITEMASARVPFWRKPLVVAAGAAAVVMVGVWLAVDGVGDKPVDSMVADVPTNWDWSGVDVAMLTEPVEHVSRVSGPGTNPPGDRALHPVGIAAAEDTVKYRDAVAKRVTGISLSAADGLADLKPRPWSLVSESAHHKVPLFAGASSWPWVERFVGEGKLPPRRAVRIEEMVNHFVYQKPDMLVAGGMRVDMELCRTPWNKETHLLAVHVQALPGADLDDVGVDLVFAPDRVNQVRLLGYGQPNQENELMGMVSDMISQTRGNFVLYELSIGDDAGELPVATLRVRGGGESLRVFVGKDGSDASDDMRFAAAIAAFGMLLSDYPDRAGLNAAEVRQYASDLLERGASDAHMDRKAALELIVKAAGLVGE